MNLIDGYSRDNLIKHSKNKLTNPDKVASFEKEEYKLWVAKIEKAVMSNKRIRNILKNGGLVLHFTDRNLTKIKLQDVDVRF